jgi:hypothetical protein
MVQSTVRDSRPAGTASPCRLAGEFLSHMDTAGMKFAQRRKDLRQWVAACAVFQQNSGARLTEKSLIKAYSACHR